MAVQAPLVQRRANKGTPSAHIGPDLLEVHVPLPFVGRQMRLAKLPESGVIVVAAPNSISGHYLLHVLDNIGSAERGATGRLSQSVGQQLLEGIAQLLDGLIPLRGQFLSIVL